MEYTITLNRCIAALHRLPGIGPKMAERLALHLVKMSPTDVHALAHALVEVKEKIMYCSVCGAITEHDPCALCSDERRAKNNVCVVEQPQDVWAIERSREYKGQYHVLMGALSPLDGIGPEQLRIKALLARMETHAIEEVILATNPTVEGEATALYLAKLLRPLVQKISRIAHGVPVGADLEYTDEVTIAKAFEGRNEMKMQ